MMAKASDKSRERNLARYEELVASFPNVERKGAAMPYTSMNGNMFSFLTTEGKLALRLDQEEREAFVKKHRTTICEQYGRVMQEYVVVPDALLKKSKEISQYFSHSVEYAETLKPKPTTRKKSKKKATTKKAAQKKATKKKATKKKATKKKATRK